MNLAEKKYSQYALCIEMMQTVEVIEKFNVAAVEPFVPAVKQNKNILITGEGSSRIFPGKHFRYHLLANGIDYNVVIEGATQSAEYQLDDYVVFGLSNSGKTKELVELFTKLKDKQHPVFYGITATPNTPVGQLATDSLVLSCGKEDAVAATKSVVEQGLFFSTLLAKAFSIDFPSLKEFAAKIQLSLEHSIPSEIINYMIEAPVIYFAGRNNGVAEELALKTNEITRKKSDFLEGTYALHGIEEVMNAGEVLVVIDPFEQEEIKFKSILEEDVGVHVIAISSRETIFPTIRIPDGKVFNNYIELAAGWNLLVETGIALGIDLDKPVRARKIGNEI
ncbi:SIS domain-containing protein [Roseimarinus sediminis]|uniref:SIS domain-containing protein n=1 Tax=Roseimarinus sediminis TaxID=1610899 RepID=UPI003D198EC5